MNLLKEKVCLITGTSRGIGKIISERFAEEGAIVYANSRTEGNIDAYCEELVEKYHTEVLPIYFDVTDEVAVKKAIVLIKQRHQRLDVLVNNAGIMQDNLIGMINKELMQRVFDVNVFSTINLMQMANKLMSRQKSGSIINMASIAGVNGNEGQLVYSASKGAVIAMTKAAAKELAPYNIRVNAVAPGMIDTDMFRSIGDKKMNENLDKIHMGRFGNPKEVADACVFLASDLSGYVTGQILGVDGATVV